MHAHEWNLAYKTWVTERKCRVLPKNWNHYAINITVNFSIAVWAKRCSDSKEKFPDSEYELIIYNCENTLLSIQEDPSQLLKDDRRSLIVTVQTLIKYPF